MATESQYRSSELADPLHNYSSLSLFPRTFGSAAEAPDLDKPNDIESLHSFLKTMALRSPQKLLQQAESIVNSGAELLKSNFPTYGSPEAVASDMEKLRERRPALGRKRARFSLKPKSSQPPVSSELSFDPILDIDRLQDPEEYFLAHEKLENTQKELQRQRGSSSVCSTKNFPPTTERRRRPGIFGKSVSYKHHYSGTNSDNDRTLELSHENVDQSILSPSDCILEEEATDQGLSLLDSELSDALTKTENKVNELLDELLSSTCEYLDGDGAINVLQQRLKIKPMNLDKLQLPDLHGIQKSDSKATCFNMPKHRSLLHNKTLPVHGQDTECSIHHSPSPIPPKSPFSSISLLKRNILKNHLQDPYPFPSINVDLSPARNSSSIECNDIQTDTKREESGFSGKLVVANTYSHEVELEDPTCPSKGPVNDNLEIGVGVHLNDYHHNMESHIGETNANDNVIDENIVGLDIEIEATTNTSCALKEHDGNMLLKSEALGQSGAYVGLPIMDKENYQSSSAPVDAQATGGPLKSPKKERQQPSQEPSNISSDKQSEDNINSRGNMNDQTKARTRPHKKRKRNAVSRKQSLAGAGTSWESGLRRSSRIKFRPLEYWKGERFLYGRIHQSLATVIGLKYVSPAKNDKGKPTLRVKSFVSDEYKDLVELAALH